MKLFKLSFCVSDGIMWTNVFDEFCEEIRVVVQPSWWFVIIICKQVRLKPFKCGPLEIGLHEHYLSSIGAEFFRMRLEIQLALN